MPSNKLSLLLLALVGALAIALAPACGDDGGTTTTTAGDGDGDGDGDADAAVTPDAPNNTSNAIGQACTPSQTDPQGDCPTDHTCLTLQGGSGSWCSKACEAQSDPVCTNDYTGPGVPRCVFQVSDGTTSTNYCAIICEDLGAGICTSPTCPATCPTPLTCTAELMGGNPPATVAKACE